MEGEWKDSLKILQIGNQRFVKELSAHQIVNNQRRRELINGQAPHTIIFTCSDSRVPPELIFDSRIGDLFVIRNAGNVFDENALGSIEYAVAHLKTPLLIVMGHEECGAVKSAMATDADTAPGCIAKIIRAIKPVVDSTPKESADFLASVIKSNCQHTVKQIKESSTIVASAIQSGELVVLTAYYSFVDGIVHFL